MDQYRYMGKVHKQLVFEKLMKIWDQYAAIWRELPFRYLGLWEEARELGIEKRFQIADRTLRSCQSQMPVFFEIENREEAKKYLYSLNKTELDQLSGRIKCMSKKGSPFKKLEDVYYDMDYTVGLKKEKIARKSQE